MNTDLETLARQAEGPGEAIKARGFFRIAITAPGDEFTVVGDSGWLPNQITAHGYLTWLRLLAGSASTSVISAANVGTGGVPATDATTLSGELVGTNAAVQRATLQYSSNANSKALSFLGTLNSTASFCTVQTNISNVGLFFNTTGGTLFAGNTYTSSTCGTNQNVNITYTISFS